MPALTLEVPETYNSVTRPVVAGVIRDLIDYLELPNDTDIKYQGSAESSAKTGSELSRRNRSASFPFDNEVKVDVAEQYLEEGILTTPINRFDVPYFFYDRALGVSIKPVYYQTETTISFEYRARSKSAAYNFRDVLYRRSIMAIDSLFHELLYHFPIPDAFTVILKEIHRLRENQSGYGETLEEWFNNHYSSNKTDLTNIAGRNALPAISEKQIQVMGWTSYITTPEDINKKEEGETWNVNFEYKFRYDKPTAAVMVYPIIVHNQLLSDRYLDKNTVIYNPYDQPRRHSLSTFLNEQFSALNASLTPELDCIRIPAHDDWRPASRNKNTRPIFNALIRVETEQPRKVVNLSDLGMIRLGQSVMNFLFRHRRKILNRYASAFFLEVYRGGEPLESSLVHIDDDMNVMTNFDLNPRSVYHVTLSIVSEPAALSRPAVDDLRNDPEVCIHYIDLLDADQISQLPLGSRSGAHAIADGFAKKVPHWAVRQAQASHDNIGPLESFERFSEATKAGLCTLAVKNTDDDFRQPVIAHYHTELYSFVVRHNLQGRIEDLRVISAEEFATLMEQDFIPVSGNWAVGEVVSRTGQVKPTLANSKARRMTSPTRPKLHAPLVSDELKILGGKVVTVESFNFAIKHFKKTSRRRTTRGDGMMKTIMLTGVVAQSG